MNAIKFDSSNNFDEVNDFLQSLPT